MVDEFPNIRPIFWKNALGCTLQVETINKQVFTGRLYVVDPQSFSIVLIHEDKSILIIPGHAVHKVNCDTISFEEHDISDFLDSQCNKTSPIKENEFTERKDRLKKWLTQNGLHIEDNAGTLKCQDHVFIEAPYNDENCFCTNVILLERIRDVLAKLPID